jgi:hypothetical protein
VLGDVHQLQALVPEADELRGGLWTAILAGILGAYLTRVSARSEIPAAELVNASMRRVDPALLELARDLAQQYGADPDLVVAILLVENLQRPGWIRAIERVVGRLLPIGSYGIMQVKTDKPISDRESIELAISTRLAGQVVPLSGKFIDRAALTAIIRSYNGNRRFVELVETVYWELRGT